MYIMLTFYIPESIDIRIAICYALTRLRRRFNVFFIEQCYQHQCNCLALSSAFWSCNSMSASASDWITTSAPTICNLSVMKSHNMSSSWSFSSVFLQWRSSVNLMLNSDTSSNLVMWPRSSEEEEKLRGLVQWETCCKCKNNTFRGRRTHWL